MSVVAVRAVGTGPAQLADHVRSSGSDQALHRQPHRRPGEPGSRNTATRADGAGDGARQHRGRADLGERQHAEQLAVAVDPLLEQAATASTVGRARRRPCRRSAGRRRPRRRATPPPRRGSRRVVGQQRLARDGEAGPLGQLAQPGARPRWSRACGCPTRSPGRRDRAGRGDNALWSATVSDQTKARLDRRSEGQQTGDQPAGPRPISPSGAPRQPRDASRPIAPGERAA